MVYALGLLWLLVAVMLVIAVLGPRRTQWPRRTAAGRAPSATANSVAGALGWVMFFALAIIAAMLTVQATR